MKAERKIVLIPFCLGVAFYVIDAMVDAWLFRSDSLLGSLITNVSPAGCYRRFIVFACLILSGAIVSIFVRKHRQIESQLRQSLDEVHRRKKELTSIVESSHAVLIQDTFRDVSRSMVDACKKLLNDEAGSAFFLSVSDNAIEILRSNAKHFSTCCQTNQSDRIGTLIEQTTRSKQVIVENELDGYEWEGFNSDARECLQNIMLTPLVIDGETCGQLGLINKAGGFSEDDTQIIHTFAELAAVALKNCRKMEAMKESEKRYRDLVENTAVAVWRIDLTGRFTYANPAVKNLYGYDPTELIGKTPEVVLAHGTDIPKVKDSLKRRLAGEFGDRESSMELMLKHKDGSCFVGELLTIPVYDSAGQLVEISGITRDVSRRKQAEDDLRRERDFANRLIEMAQFIIAVLDVEGRIVLINPFMETISGYTRKDVIHKDWFSTFLPENDQKRVRAFFKHGVNNFNIRGNVNSIVTKDGRLLDIEWCVKTLKDAQGKTIGVLSTGHDISDRKQSEEAMRFQAQLLDCVRESIMVVNSNGRIVYWGNGAVYLYGYRAEEAIGKSITLIAELGKEDVTRQRFQQVMQDGFSTGKTVYRRKNNSLVWVDQSISLVSDSDGKPYGVIAIDRDITDRIHAEAEKDKLENQLRQAQKMEAIGLLAGGVAHDFNNLLTAIIGYSDIVLGKLDSDDTIRRSVEQIRKAGERASSLTQQLLAFSRKQVLKVEMLDLNGLILNMEKMLRRLIGETIELVTVPGADLGRVKADPGQIEQIVMNLVINSRDAMPQGGKITIETANQNFDADCVREKFNMKAGSYVMLAVSDTGCGMDAAMQERVFDPFFTTKEQGKGTGLGLSTVYGIVKQSGGYIFVYSEPGQGTVFKIYLPQVVGELTAGTIDPLPATSLTGTETILLVEDEEIVRNLVVHTLQQYGYTVFKAGLGAEAIRFCESYEGPIHLLLTDVVLPKMSGVEIAKHLAASRPDMNVLYISGYTGEAIVQHGILNEGIEFLQKPFSPDTLVRKVRAIFDSRFNRSMERNKPL